MNDMKDMKHIPISCLKRDQFNTFEITHDLTVQVFFEGDDIRVVQDICPHMGVGLLDYC